MAVDWQVRLRRGRFVVLGRVGMDLYADPPGQRIQDARGYVAAIGGSAGNIAVALARQGVAAALLTAVSDDAVGAYCRAELARYGVDIRHVFMRGGRTSLAVAETRADAQVVLYRQGAADFGLTATDVAGLDFAPVGGLIVTGTALAAEPSRGAARAAMVAARAAGAVVVLDIDHRAYSWASDAEAAAEYGRAADAADVVIGNDAEFALLGGIGAARDLGKRCFAVYKKGGLGSVTFAGDLAIETAIYPVQAQKPMGAGDGFMGGLMAGLAQGFDLEAALRRGAATAAMIVAGVGCAPASPSGHELDAFMAERAGDAHSAV